MVDKSSISTNEQSPLTLIQLTKNMTYNSGNPGTGLRRAQTYDGG